MFQWFAQAAVCYVHLADVSTRDELVRSRWFTRSWTLQELVAPKDVRFFSSDWEYLGDKLTLHEEVFAAARIDVLTPLRNVPIWERFSWSLNRLCTRSEDEVYSLLGLLEVDMVVLYGEGSYCAHERLFERVQETHGEIIGTTVQFTWYAHNLADSSTAQHDIQKTSDIFELLQSLYNQGRGLSKLDNASPFPGTCTWLLSNKAFRAWIEMESSRLLWIKGKPGSGKSTLMRFAAENLPSDSQVVQWSFSMHGHELQRSASGLYRVLLFELLRVPGALPGNVLQHILGIYTDRKHINSTWTDAVLETALRMACEALKRPVRCFVDALDECHNKQIMDMIHFFEDIRFSNLYICFSSRYYPLIHIRQSVEIHLEQEVQHSKDIETYIRRRLARHWPNTTGYGLDARISTKAGGFFLWAVLLVRVIDRELSKSSMRTSERLLDFVPGRLCDFYDSFITVPDSDSFRLCIMWLLFSTRPLSSVEIFYGIQTKLALGAVHLTLQSDVPAQFLADFLVKQSKGLAEINIDAALNARAQFIHESVRNYFLRHGGLKRLMLGQADTHLESVAHDILKGICHDYVHQLPTAHAQKQTFLSWRAVKELVQCGVDVDEGLEPPLIILAGTDNADVPTFELLLSRGANVDAQTSTGESALHRAVSKPQHLDIVHALLACGADVNLSDRTGKTSLMVASESGCLAISQELLKHGAYVNSVDLDGSTPLLYATMKDHEDIIQLLLDAGADPNAINKYGQSALLVASLNGYRSVSRLQVRAGEQPKVESNSSSMKYYEKSQSILPDSWSVTTDSTAVTLDDYLRLRGSMTFALTMYSELPVDELDEDDMDCTKSHDPIRGALVMFAFSMQQRATSQAQRYASRLVRQQSGTIVENFLNKILRAPALACGDEPRPDAAITSSHDAVQEWLKDEHIEGDPPPDLPPDSSEAIPEQEDMMVTARNFLVDNEVFRWLLARTRLFMTKSPGHNMQKISRTLYRATAEQHRMSTDITTVDFIIDWNPSHYLHKNYQTLPDIGDVIVLTSDDRQTQATTISEYMSTTWPCSGRQMLQYIGLVISAMAGPATPGSGVTKSFEWLKYKASIQISIEIDVRITIRAPAFLVVEVGEQLAWLGSSCREASHPDTQSCCSPKISVSRPAFVTGHCEVQIRFPESAQTLDTDQDAQCWRSLFRNVCIGDGFPISLRREGERGLEIPFRMMAQLGGADRIADYAGQRLLKGFETLFVPVCKTATSIVWHLLTEVQGKRVSLNAFIDRQVLAEPSVDLACIWRARHFLGWVSKATQHAGTRNAHYKGNSAVFVHAAKPGLVLEKASISLSHILGGAVTAAQGQVHQGIRTSDSNLSYSERVDRMRDMHILLYDDPKQRGWLLDGASAVLHLLRFHLDRDPSVREAKLIDMKQFPYAPDQIGCDAAIATLKADQTRKTELIREVVKESEVTETIIQDGKTTTKTTISEKTVSRTIADKVMELWACLEDMYDAASMARRRPGLNTNDLLDHLEGWRFEDVASMKMRIEPKFSKIDAKASGWHRLAQNVNAVVLLGGDFGLMIRPTDQCCAKWKQLPPQQYCLAVPVQLLKRIYETNGDKGGFTLAKDVCWTPIEHTFRCSCAERQRRPGQKCDPRQILSRSTILMANKAKITPLQLFSNEEYAQGAIMFGHRKLQKDEQPALASSFKKSSPFRRLFTRRTQG
ncbi:hypothetical protein AMS68_003968 [Peltaster fructicola]|uniref:Nephrocystin 3-like N-terminal domain-containing protein n=1 Tax=Peltaster fructicola TaxID=286661 RepID=A0A6H0XUV5_9PEZI|nr:hypothetical protein AMS68_003968 [Peltaster fructicola]